MPDDEANEQQQLSNSETTNGISDSGIATQNGQYAVPPSQIGSGHAMVFSINFLIL